jgi:dTDP-4-dehydrorhamnose 3,5-epimerase
VKFVETPLAGAFVIELEPNTDDRGFFARSFCTELFAENGLPTIWPQENVSANTEAGTLRGLHFNAPGHREAKTVTCTNGSIFDVIVDLRRDSPTFLDWFGIELTAGSRSTLFIPEDFAHGFLTLDAATEVRYRMSHPYRPGVDDGLRWDDPALAIDWPSAPEVIHPRDASYPLLDERSEESL